MLCIWCKSELKKLTLGSFSINAMFVKGGGNTSALGVDLVGPKGGHAAEAEGREPILEVVNHLWRNFSEVCCQRNQLS